MITEQKDEIKVAVESWLWVRVALMAWFLSRLEHPMELTDREFQYHSGQLSLAVSRNPSGVNNTTYLYGIYIYGIYVVLRFFDSRYKVSLTWDLNPRAFHFCSDAVPTELASLKQGWSSTVDVYMRSDIEAQKLVPGC